jgi:hypothetical protein
LIYKGFVVHHHILAGYFDALMSGLKITAMTHP